MTERLTSETEAGVNSAKGQEAEGDGKKRGMTRVHRWRARGAQRRSTCRTGDPGPRAACAPTDHGEFPVAGAEVRGGGRGRSG